MITYLKTLEIYDKTKLALFFADTAEDLSASASHPGINYDEIAPGSKCTVANGDKYFLNSSKEWVKIESGSSPSPTPTPSEHVLEITPVCEGGSVMDQESIDILNELEDNYLNGDCSDVLKVNVSMTTSGGEMSLTALFRSFFVYTIPEQGVTVFSSNMCSCVGNDLYLQHLIYDNYGTEEWYFEPTDIFSSNSNSNQYQNFITDAIKNRMANRATNIKPDVSEPAKVVEATVEEVKEIKE